MKVGKSKGLYIPDYEFDRFDELYNWCKKRAERHQVLICTEILDILERYKRRIEYKKGG